MTPHWKDNLMKVQKHIRNGLKMHPKGSRGQCLKFTFTNFLFEPVQSTEIPGDISEYRTALKCEILNTIT